VRVGVCVSLSPQNDNPPPPETLSIIIISGEEEEEEEEETTMRSNGVHELVICGQQS